MAFGLRLSTSDHLPQAELASYMARGRAVILPSFSEGLPKVVFEAMLCGTPVIASAIDGILEILQDDVQGYLVPPGDIPALAAAIRRVFYDDHVDQLGAEGRRFALALFSPEAYVEAYGKLFVTAKKVVHNL